MFGLFRLPAPLKDEMPTLQSLASMENAEQLEWQRGKRGESFVSRIVSAIAVATG